ncbi:MAG: 2-C-methyl-D-erythritol 2,4-cyclodiphosphate synthase [Thermodesulfovibrionia bacterium]|nr:2-C-methyl-D-erythritol 2,4-cyclodiphosphate synthase [Thermodesulfovibrionia bacterium]MCK5426986.1 2-C-methyl-D-erythritol 2,4-cyclodiphosphate synthase [Thermodesulfovibrionia bacterium]
MMRIGFGYDSHRLIKGRKLILGGLEIPHEKGLHGHSDADVLCHAIIDSIIGALGLGDMGKYFPDTDQQWKNASSIDLLLKTLGLMKKKGFEILWIDTTVIAEKPKLEPYINTMKSNLSKIGISENVINIKAKTNEGMGFIGKGEGIAAHAVCLLKPE